MNHDRSVSANNRPLDYSFDIGLKSENDRKMRQMEGKRHMLDELDRQLHMKDEQKRMEKMQNAEMQYKNQRIQQENFNKRSRSNGKNYGQDPRVYQYYQDLNMQKMRRERQLEHRLVDEAAMQLAEKDYKRKQFQVQKKNDLNHQMKETLDQQVKNQHYRKAEEHRVNPEDVSFAVISHMFREKPSAYDKKQYSEFLKMQASDQKRKQN